MKVQIRDYDLANNIDVLFEKKIVIYGIGKYGRRSACLLEDAGVGFDCFCDRNEGQKQHLSHPVITLDEMQEKVKQENCMIVVGSNDYCEEMIEELARREIAAYTCTWYGLQTGIEINIEDARFSKAFQEEFMRRKELYVSLNNPMIWPLVERCRNYRLLCQTPNAFWVYQPAKVGCTTVKNTLIKAKLDAVGIHYIVRPVGIESIDKVTTYFMERIKHGRTKIKIVTLVREPIARALSYFMQGFTHNLFVVSDLEKGCALADSASKFMTEELLDTNQEFEWFDEELKELTGIDIYQYPFDKEKGYTWIKEGNIEILVLKLEKLKENIAVLGEFAGKPDIELYNSNVGGEKHYKYIYEELKKKIKIPARVLEAQYKNNWQLDHFYTEEEKERFRQKWSKHVFGENSMSENLL